MTTVKQLIEYLQKQDQEAAVRLNVVDNGHDYSTTFVDLDLEMHVSYVDLRGNPFVKDDAPYKDKRFLEFGD